MGEETGYPVAWITPEESDNDFRQFLNCILTALQRAVDYFNQATFEVSNSSLGIDCHQISGLLANDLYKLNQQLILVLEDYHLIENENVNQFIESILNKAISPLHLIISTREDPPLPLARMRVRNQLTEIRAIDLSFSLEEANEFLSNVMGLALISKQIEVLSSRTEGWVAGLQLAALSLKQSRNPAGFVEAFRGTHWHILDYLMEEVLSSQSKEMREFLYQTSILDQLSPSLCDAVTGSEESRKHLLYLENNNLFLVALDEERPGTDTMHYLANC